MILINLTHIQQIYLNVTAFRVHLRSQFRIVFAFVREFEHVHATNARSNQQVIFVVEGSMRHQPNVRHVLRVHHVVLLINENELEVSR